MSQTTLDAGNPELLELQEKILKIANLQADTTLKQIDMILKQQQTRFLPWQVWTAGMTAGAAVAGAAVAFGHWL